MEKRTFLTSDQYVVKKLEEVEQQLEKTISENQELTDRLVAEKCKNEQMAKICGMFKLENTETSIGYKITFNYRGESYPVAFCFSDNFDENFKDLLVLLGLEPDNE